MVTHMEHHGNSKGTGNRRKNNTRPKRVEARFKNAAITTEKEELKNTTCASHRDGANPPLTVCPPRRWQHIHFLVEHGNNEPLGCMPPYFLHLRFFALALLRWSQRITRRPRIAPKTLGVRVWAERSSASMCECAGTAENRKAVQTTDKLTESAAALATGTNVPRAGVWIGKLSWQGMSRALEVETVQSCRR